MPDATYMVDNGAILQFVLYGRQNSQNILNTFHWVVRDLAAAAAGIDIIADLHNELFTAGVPLFKTAFLAMFGDGYFLESVTYQFIYPTRWLYKRYDVGAVGTTVGDMLPQNTAGNITFKGEGGLGVVPRVGRMQLGGMVVDDAFEGFTTVAWRIRANELREILQETQLTPACNLVPIVFNRALPLASQTIVDSDRADYVRTQRTRTVGRGE